MSSLYWLWEKELTPEKCQDIIDRAGDDFEDAVIGTDSTDLTIKSERLTFIGITTKTCLTWHFIICKVQTRRVDGTYR